MDKKLLILSAASKFLPLLLLSGALLLFAAGYLAHSLWGPNNAVEQVAEELLAKDYDIIVEFSGGEKR